MGDIADADFVALMKSMSPSALDAEFRMLQLVDEEDENEDEDGERSKELVDIGLLMDFFAHETKANKEFEFLQALIQLFLKVMYILPFLFCRLLLDDYQTRVEFCLRFHDLPER